MPFSLLTDPCSDLLLPNEFFYRTIWGSIGVELVLFKLSLFDCLLLCFVGICRDLETRFFEMRGLKLLALIKDFMLRLILLSI